MFRRPLTLVILVLAILFAVASAQNDGISGNNKAQTCYCYCCRSDATNTGRVRPCDENNLSIHTFIIANPIACTSQACSSANPVICPVPDRELGINRAGCQNCQQGIDGLTPPGKSKTEIPFDDPSSSTQLDLSMWSYVALLAVTVCNLLF